MPGPMRAQVLAEAAQGYVAGLDQILAIAACVALVAAVITAVLIRQRDFHDGDFHEGGADEGLRVIRPEHTEVG